MLWAATRRLLRPQSKSLIRSVRPCVSRRRRFFPDIIFSSQKAQAPAFAGAFCCISFEKNTLRQRRSVFSVIHIVENSLAGLGQPQLVAGQVLNELLVILLGQVGLQRLVLLGLLL